MRCDARDGGDRAQAPEVLEHRKPFVDLGDQYLTRRSQTDVTRKLVRRLESLGFDVALTPREVA
jgi:hypothetical protein